jgi:hypothetical protein
MTNNWIQVLLLLFVALALMLAINTSKELWTNYGIFLNPVNPADFSGRIDVPLELRLFQQPTPCFQTRMQSQHANTPHS